MSIQDSRRQRAHGGSEPATSGTRRTRRRVAVSCTAIGAALVPAGAAHAGVISVANPAFDNTCANVDGGADANGATAASAGTAGGNNIGLPLSLPRNDCGRSGIVCIP